MGPIYQLIKPESLLEDHIYFYTHFKSFIPEDECIYMMPSTDIKLSFNFADCAFIKDIREKSLAPVKTAAHVILGLQTKRNFDLILKKNTLYNSLVVFFKPHGFYDIFNISPASITDHYFSFEGKAGKELTELADKLSKMNLCDQATLLNNYFIKKLEQIQVKRSSIAFASQSILSSAKTLNLKKLACDCNLSPRQFERIFKEFVGISAMKLQSINRFETCLKLKERIPQKNWTNIAFEAGYTDQMHLVREFKKLSLLTPSSIHWKSGIDGKHWHFLRKLVDVNDRSL
ncbi:helix-turn-helix domain-containing protein [Mucilaginibacter sp. X5P1]|uniref:helix-turn-helix domain-containing protein n=1 Tax=Mucilaginibacter sp. X5P1 TaxID=2723088 RepID=UPI001614415A|nr:AraC family transcriptional regulator [Mucilaginibacter sp. X5P1]MBB6140099.1 AraC-like DNA-binding protein [Mucilaginibacter sp. X5P1]